MRFRRKKQEACQILFVNETTRILEFVKGKASEGQIHYKDRAWLVQTDPLFYKDKALYIVSDRQIPTFEIEFTDSNAEPTEQRETQNSVKPESLSPTALKTAVTSAFFKALMSPIHWDLGDWLKAIGVGFSFYMVLKWILTAIFKVPLP